jgi:hypothetical protein
MQKSGAMRTQQQTQTTHSLVNLMAGGLVAVGLLTVAAAIYWRSQYGILDLREPLQAAGAFVFAGLAFVGLTHLADAQGQVDHRIAAAAAAAKAAENRAESAERRYDEREKRRDQTGA